MEATTNRADGRNGSALEPWKFGSPTRDPAEFGRKGGIASGESRRLKPLKRLKRGIDESRNGAAKAKLLEIELREQAELLAERRRRDAIVCELIEMESELLHQVRELEVERERVRAEYTEMRERIASDEGLVALLLDAGEERVERACVACGWFEAES